MSSTSYCRLSVSTSGSFWGMACSQRSKAQLIGAAPAAVDVKTSWPDLSDEQGCEMDQAVALLKEAANQWHLEAQAACGNLCCFAYCFGWGVTQDERLALMYCERAAQ